MILGSYTCQIFWKGDPSIENFIIRFTTEDALKKWATQIETQRRRYRDDARMSTARSSDGSRAGTSVTQFAYMQDQGPLENPYKLDVEEDEEDDDVDTLLSGSQSGWSGPGFPSGGSFSQSRNGSSSSLRSRSTTGESGSQVSSASTRAPLPRLPHSSMQQQPLSLRTRELQQVAQSPGGGPQDSYFSPTVSDSPMSSSMSSRTSASSGMYPFPRQAIPQNGYYEDGHGGTRFTAPAMPRPAPNAAPNGYGPPGRAPSARPAYPPGSVMHSAQQMPGPRNRSASSPDIHNGQRIPLRNGSQPPVPEMPATYQNRSHTNSPGLIDGVPNRASPQMMRDRQYSNQESSPIDGYAGPPRAYPPSRTVTPVASRGQSFQSPPSETGATPAQLKVKVHCPSASQTLTLVVSSTITYQTLKDRIDAKLQRSTNLTLGDRVSKENQVLVKLKYLDEDDFVSIQSDEDVVTAFETWREQKGEGLGGMGEIELFCQR